MLQKATEIVVGVISDTHGLLRPEALEALAEVDHIIHAGDIGDDSVIRELESIAPVTAVRGNVDKGGWANAWPETELFQLGGRYIYLLHNLDELDIDPVAAGVDVVISGHSHKPHQFHRDGVLYLNPGSIGPRRFSLPIAMARLTLGDADLRVECMIFD